MEQDNQKGQISLSPLRISFMYFGVLMGAGFASGKEMWQFFGVFGGKGIPGILLVSLIFIGLGFVIVSVSKHLGTDDLSKIIFPFDNELFERAIGIIVAAFLFMAYFSMLAAGGSLLEHQLGIHKSIGSILLMFIVVLTAIKGFGKVSDRMGKVVPILLTATLLLALYIIIFNHEDISFEQISEASPLAPNWLPAAIIFVSYNMMGAIPILGSCTLYSENARKAKKGAMLGGVFLGSCALILYLTMLTDPLLAASSPLPMLSFSSKISAIVNVIYSGILLISIFGTSTSCFYGYCTKIPKTDKRVYLIWLSAVAGLGLSQVGFSNIVAFIYPLEGYLGFLFLVLLIWNYIRIRKGKRNTMNHELE